MDDNKTLINAFVKVRINDKSIFDTEVIDNNKNPVWNHVEQIQLINDDNFEQKI